MLSENNKYMLNKIVCYFLLRAWLRLKQQQSKSNCQMNVFHQYEIKRECGGVISGVYGHVWMNRVMCVAVVLPTHTGSYKQKTAAQE